MTLLGEWEHFVEIVSHKAQSCRVFLWKFGWCRILEVLKNTTISFEKERKKRKKSEQLTSKGTLIFNCTFFIDLQEEPSFKQDL